MPWIPSLLAAAPADYSYSYEYETHYALSPFHIILIVAIAIVTIASLWKIFTKAGQPGWAAIVPIYNLWVLALICGKEGWWGLLCFIPIVGIVFMIILYIELAKRFGKGGGFAVGLVLLGFIFFPILAFGDAQYQRA